jgi:retinol dehydrogenase-12
LKVGRIQWDDIMLEKSFSTWKAYTQSKLANILFTRELAKRLPQGVTTYAVHPGTVKTDISNNFKEHYGARARALEFVLKPFIILFFKTPAQGARTTIYCAVDEALQTSSGKYYADCREEALQPHALNNDDALRLWDLSNTLVSAYLK